MFPPSVWGKGILHTKPGKKRYLYLRALTIPDASELKTHEQAHGILSVGQAWIKVPPALSYLNP